MKRRVALILILLLSIILGACNSKNNKTSDGKTVDVYYINPKTSGLVSESYELITTEKNDQISELLYTLQNPKHIVYKNALPDNVLSENNSEKFGYNNGSLTIDFAASYNELSVVSQVLCRAAIVKTLCQLSDIDYIQFYVNGQRLKDSDGDMVGTLTAEDFIDNTETSNSYKVKLYFANKSGDALIEHIEDINYTGTETIEELVIGQLINGPIELGMYSTIPEGTILLNVSKTDDICTVDFNEKFLEKLPNITKEVAIYSVVNSLVELPDINKVQFTINSKVQKTYWEDQSFDVPFESKLDLIDTTE